MTTTKKNTFLSEDTLLADWTQHVERYPDEARGLIVCNSRQELKYLLERTQNVFPALGAQWRAHTKMWVFPDGASLLLNYLENYDDAVRYMGSEFTFVGADVSSFKEQDLLKYLGTRVRSKRPTPQRSPQVIASDFGSSTRS